MTPSVIETHTVGARGTPAVILAPDAVGPLAVIVLLHERYGLVQHTLESARRLATYGYFVVAPDLFATHPDQAGLQSGTVQAKPPDADVLRLLEDAVGVAARDKRADLDRLCMIGVCQTGRYPFLWAAHHPLRACVVLYGAAMPRDWVVNERQPWGMAGLIDRIGTSVLGLFGEGDFIIPIDDVLRLRAALEARSTDYQLSIYPDAPHGWLNDTMPGRYRPVQAAEAWEEIRSFLSRRLGARSGPEQVSWTFRCQKQSDYDFAKNVRTA